MLQTGLFLHLHTYLRAVLPVVRGIELWAAPVITHRQSGSFCVDHHARLKPLCLNCRLASPSAVAVITGLHHTLPGCTPLDSNI